MCGLASGLEIFRFGRSWAVEDPCMVSFVKFATYLHRFEGEGRDPLKPFGGAWRRMRPFLGLKFLGFVDRGPMNLVVAPVL